MVSCLTRLCPLLVEEDNVSRFSPTRRPGDGDQVVPVGGRLVGPGEPPAVGRAPGDGGGAAGELNEASGQGGSRGANGIVPLGPTDNDVVGGVEQPWTHLIGWGASEGAGEGAGSRQA